MADEQEETGKIPAKVVHGRDVKYQLDGETMEIFGGILDDGGVYWVFKRDGREYPLRLSRTGMDAMIAIWHELMWARPGEGKS